MHMHSFLISIVPTGLNTDQCNPRCAARQCCDRDDENNYQCFCIQSAANDPERYIKRPCEGMFAHMDVSYS